MTSIKVVWGSANVAEDGPYGTQEQWDETAKVLKESGVDTIDTATLYGASEGLLSKFGAGKEFTIDTKAVGGFIPGHGEKDKILENGEQSQRLFGKVDIWYLHSPVDPAPIEGALEAVNEMYKRGLFKRFGLSNYKAEKVQEIYDICKAKGYPLPAVYQGNYNAVARGQEELLFPTLRKLGMSFYAYSPLAGGFLTKTKEDISSGKGRFDTSTSVGQMYSGLYARDTLLESLAKWEAIAKEEGVPRAELAYRWVAYNSPLSNKYGDALIIGSRDISQLKQTIEGLKHGPLSDKAVKSIDEIWEKIKHEAPLDNYHR